MSRTNVVLDDDLVEKCQKATGIKTRRNLIPMKKGHNHS